VGELAHKFHIVLDHERRARGADRVQQLAGAVALAPGHSCDRLVEQ